MSALAERLGPSAVEHIAYLERSFRAPRAFHVGEKSTAIERPDLDILQVGGGPAIVHAILAARRGARVAVVDRGRIGSAHREWNISGAELRPLVEHGILDEQQLQSIIVARYDEGIIQWHGGARHRMRGVLDHAVDAGRLMVHLRQRALDEGVTLVEQADWTAVDVHPGGAVCTFQQPDGRLELGASVVLDATGSSSPFSDADLACPTVGAVMRGFRRGSGPREVDPRCGEILVSTEGIEDGWQHIWEGFPAAHDEYVVYLFHYATASALPPGSLTHLYERFFRTLSRYKEGDAVLVRPTYGIIPGHTRLGRSVLAPRDRILRVGDAAGRQSPLTFCGFGSLVRSFADTTDRVLALVAQGRVDRASLAGTWTEPPQQALVGALTMMMMDRGAFGGDAEGINRLLDVSFGTLADMGDDVLARFTRDEATAAEVIAFMLRVSARHPSVFARVARNLRPRETGAWLGNAVSALLAA